MERKISVRAKAQRWYMRYPRLLPAGVFLLAMAVTILAVLAVQEAESQRLVTETRARAGAIAFAVERRGFAHIAYLRAAATLFAEPGGISDARFHDFAHELEADEEYRGGEGVSWGRLVPVRALAAFEAARRAAGDRQFTVYPRPAAGRKIAVPVTLIGHQTAQNWVSLGFDTYSEATRREAMDAAARLNRPMASGRVVLTRSPTSHPWIGFIIYMPVFVHTEGAAGAGGQGRLSGFVFMPFNAQTFLASALELTGAQKIGVSLYDGTVGPQHLLAQIIPNMATRPELAVPVTVAGRPMVLVLSTPMHFAMSSLSLLILACGTLVALLLTVLARMVTRHAMADRMSLARLREQVSIRAILTRELNHRVKNTLANVLSIIALTRHRAQDLDSFVESLKGRIRALSATHDLLTRRDWGATPVADVVATELAPYTGGPDQAVDLTGSVIELAPHDALSLGLAIHELATNASKYGALSIAGGRVSVCWSMFGTDRARIIWDEHGGPPVPSEHTRGFGTELIEKIVAHELGQPVELVFAEQGVHCVLTVPVRSPVAFQMRARSVV